ncbi:MAG: hypothetical protein ACYTG3_02290 [Planctomycetota bacterium]
MLAPVLLTLAGLVATFLPVVLRLRDLPDVVPLVLLAGGAGWAWFTWARRRGRGRCTSAVVQTLALGAVGYWMLSFSVYGAAEGVPALGEAAPLIEAVRVRDGATFRLEQQRGSTILLVFFRGAW